jgi:hypothetical protein
MNAHVIIGLRWLGTLTVSRQFYLIPSVIGNFSDSIPRHDRQAQTFAIRVRQASATANKKKRKEKRKKRNSTIVPLKEKREKE